MTKRQMIDEILQLNRTAKPEFLARFAEGDLDEYLQNLIHARASRLCGNASRYAKYFVTKAAPAQQETIGAIAVCENPPPVGEQVPRRPALEEVNEAERMALAATPDTEDEIIADPIGPVVARPMPSVDSVANAEQVAESEVQAQMEYLPSGTQQSGSDDAADESLTHSAPMKAPQAIPSALAAGAANKTSSFAQEANRSYLF